MPITGSIEADRHMGLTNRDEGQQYVTHPSRNQSRLWREPCVHVGFCCILSRNQLIQLYVTTEYCTHLEHSVGVYA